MSIFGAVAPKYFEKQMPVMPLIMASKRPLENNWQELHARLPTEHQQETWTQIYAHNNIGLVLGAQSRVCILDVDTPDEGLQKDIVDLMDALCGKSPWRRVGSKGFALAYKYNSNVQTFRLKGADGGTIVELLSSKTQLVLPPSIHPDTKQPYVANCELYDVVDDLPLISNQVEEALRGLCKDRGIALSLKGWTKITDWIPAGQRDVSLTSVAGVMALGVVRGDMTLKDAISHMRAKCSEFMTEKVEGDEVDAEKHVQNMIKFLQRDVLERNKVLPAGWDDGLTEDDKANLQLGFGVDHESWDYAQCAEYLKEKFSSNDESTAAAAIDHVMKKIAQSTALSAVDEERLYYYMKEVSGLKLSITALKRQKKEYSRGDMEGSNHTEIAKGMIGDLEQKGVFRFWNEKLYKWNGSCWEEHDMHELKKELQDRYGDLDFARRESDHRAILRVVCDQLRGDITEQHVSGVNFSNGFLREDGQLIPHNPAYGMTYTLPFRWLPEEANGARRFEEFLMDVWGHEPDFEARKQALAEAVTLTIFGWGPVFEKAILLRGAARSGKSAMLDIISSLIPDEGRSAVPPDQWSDRFAPAQLVGKILNLCGELSESRNIDGENFKSTISGEERNGQLKGQQIFRFKPKATHWFASNHDPKTKDGSAGFTRRWLIFTFTKTVPKGKTVPNLGEEIAAEEREQIVAWAISRGLKALKVNRVVTEPPSHLDAIKKVAEMNNTILYFLQGSRQVRRVQTAPEKTSNPTGPGISTAELHGAYLGFCFSSVGVRPVPLPKFRQEMDTISAELGLERKVVEIDDQTRETYYTDLILVKNSAGLSSAA